jgi:hypothetical protein
VNVGKPQELDETVVFPFLSDACTAKSQDPVPAERQPLSKSTLNAVLMFIMVMIDGLGV